MDLSSKEAKAIGTAYLALLDIPYGMWRAQNENVYCKLRDSLAKHFEASPEIVQTEFEDAAQNVRHECWMCGHQDCKCEDVFTIEVEDCNERNQHTVCRRCDERGVLDKLPTPYRILSDYWWKS